MNYYLTGEVQKCEFCDGTGYTESEGHPKLSCL